MGEHAQLLTEIATTRQSTHVAAARRPNVRLLLELLLVVGFVASLSCVIGLGIRLGRESTDNKKLQLLPAPECIHALGGGPVAPGGGLDSAAPKQYKHCAHQLAAYADPQKGAYWREVELAIADAMQVFGFSANSRNGLSSAQAALSIQTLEPGSGGVPNGLLRHSALGSIRASPATPCNNSRAGRALSHGLEASNRPSFVPSIALQQATAAAATAQSGQHRQLVPTPDKKQVVVFDIDETLLSNMQQIMDPENWPWDKWVKAAKAPPLEPVQRFYNALCSAGYSVALVTGRREAARGDTMANIEKAGYGRPCALQTAAATSIHQTRHRSSACCYMALLMRAEYDTRLASVYKPWARQQLLKNHSDFEILALVGDQFSDLNGETSAPYAFKLPNPFYYIL